MNFISPFELFISSLQLIRKHGDSELSGAQGREDLNQSLAQAASDPKMKAWCLLKYAIMW